jgi:hypothetical protein
MRAASMTTQHDRPPGREKRSGPVAEPGRPHHAETTQPPRQVVSLPKVLAATDIHPAALLALMPDQNSRAPTGGNSSARHGTTATSAATATLMRGARIREDDWRPVAARIASLGPTFSELELARWGPTGREHFGDPRPGDYPGREACHVE